MLYCINYNIRPHLHLWCILSKVITKMYYNNVSWSKSGCTNCFCLNCMVCLLSRYKPFKQHTSKKASNSEGLKQAELSKNRKKPNHKWSRWRKRWQALNCVLQWLLWAAEMAQSGHFKSLWSSPKVHSARRNWYYVSRARCRPLKAKLLPLYIQPPSLACVVCATHEERWSEDAAT